MPHGWGTSCQTNTNNGLESTVAFYGLNKENNNEQVDTFCSDPDGTYIRFSFAAHTFTNDAGDSLTLDGRFDVRYQDKGGDHNGEWNSGSSRFGLKGQMGLDNGWTGFGHAEWGYNSGANGDNIYDRLLYAGVEHEKYGKIAAGTKQWSTFYDVAWFTDMGRVFGSRGSGYYNLSDWGISSGTGRAENSITYRNNINDNWKYGFTYQTTREDVAVSTRFNQTNSDTVTLKTVSVLQRCTPLWMA